MGKKAKWAIGVVADRRASARVVAMSAAKRGNKAVEVRIEPVQKRDLVASVTASGQVRPQTKVDVASDISGKIIKLAVKEGQMVTPGQFLLQIDPTQPQAAVERAEAALASSARAARAGAGQPRPGAEELRPLGRDQEGEPAAHLRRAARAAQDRGRREQGAGRGGASTRVDQASAVAATTPRARSARRRSTRRCRAA